MDVKGFEQKMARHWLPVQGFDENLADHVFGVNVGRFEARSKSEEAEEVRMISSAFLLFALFYTSLLGVSIFATNAIFCSLPFYLRAVLSRPALYDSDE